MLVTFKCKAYANITMLGDVAIRLLKLMGHSGIVPGSILAKDVPEALSLLQSALQKTEENEDQVTSLHNNEGESEVSLALRAFPLVELLTQAVQEKCNVMWDIG